MSGSVSAAAETRLRREPAVPSPRVRSGTAGLPAVRHVSHDLTYLLADAARRSRLALGADHASVLLVDAAGHLVPTVAASREDDEVLWSRFRAMEPLGLDTIPLAESVMTGSRPIVIHDARASDVVPEEWVVAFDVRSAAIAPLVVDGVLRGALVVDHTGAPHEYTEIELRLLESFASPLRYLLAVRDVVDESQRRHRLLDHVAQAGRDLSAARTRHEVLQTGMEAVVAVLGATSCSVNVVAADGTVETLASRGVRQPEPGRHAPADLDDAVELALRVLGDPDTEPRAHLLATRARPWAGQPSAVFVPMTEPGSAVRAFAIVGRERPTAPEPDDLDVARSLAAQTWLAYERVSDAAGLAKRIEFLESLYSLAAEAVLPDMQVVLQRLAPAVRSGTGAELIDTFLCDAAAARIFGTPTPNRALGPVVRRWRREADPRPVTMGDLLVVPMLVDDAVAGALRVRPSGPVDPAAEALILAVASGIGGVVSRVLLRTRVAESERQLAVAEERERVGRDLHDTLGQQLFALRVEVESCAANVGDKQVAARLREIVNAISRANSDLRLAIHALSFLELAKRGLVPSLRSLVRKVAETTDIGIQLRVTGTPRPLPHGCEEALFRVAHEALVNVVRHSRASTATLTISFAAERTSLIVRDDGTGMSARSEEQPGLHFGLRTMQRRMAEIGGGLDVSNFRPHGVCLHAWIPTP